MEESDLCMMLEDIGVVLDRATWTHFKEVYARSHESKENGKFFLGTWFKLFLDCWKCIIFTLERPGVSGLQRADDVPEDADVDESNKVDHGNNFLKLADY